MNKQELLAFMRARGPSPATRHFDVTKLTCYGCAHSRGRAEYPSGPSGERPCCSCIRNVSSDRQEASLEKIVECAVVECADGNARCFDPFAGTLYNGAPTVSFPQDNYVTLDSIQQIEFFDDHPDYVKSIVVGPNGEVIPVE